MAASGPAAGAASASGRLTVNDNRLRPGHRKGAKLLGERIVERALAFGAADPDLAGRWCPRPQLDGVRLGKVEGNEKRGILHAKCQALRLRRNWLGKGQREVQ